MAVKQIRWYCPSGWHAAILGSTKPPRDATVRFCLACSAKSKRMVKRIPAVLVKKRTARQLAEKERREEAALARAKEQEAKAIAREEVKAQTKRLRAEMRERALQAKREKKPDFAVAITFRSGVTRRNVYDKLTGSEGALAAYRDATHFPHASVKILRIAGDECAEGCFQSGALTHWSVPGGRLFPALFDKR